MEKVRQSTNKYESLPVVGEMRMFVIACYCFTSSAQVFVLSVVAHERSDSDLLHKAAADVPGGGTLLGSIRICEEQLRNYYASAKDETE